jgi:hypothetical protein
MQGIQFSSTPVPGASLQYFELLYGVEIFYMVYFHFSRATLLRGATRHAILSFVPFHCPFQGPLFGLMWHFSLSENHWPPPQAARLGSELASADKCGCDFPCSLFLRSSMFNLR